MKLIHEAKQERKDWAHKRDADLTLWKENSQTAQEKLPVCQYESALCIFLDSPYNHNYTLKLGTAPVALCLQVAVMTVCSSITGLHDHKSFY